MPNTKTSILKKKRKNEIDANNKEMIKIAPALISKKNKGTYTLSEIYGAKWDEVESPTSFGRFFKKNVCAKKLKNILLHPEPNTKTVQNHHLYDIKKK